ncbi:LOW QUALITY PROTEIN: uncharacterized protein LOC122636182 [Vespula pensylvanica]|nr:LOW QUALITY PROTEIN: uncharacterized protein LOC122636182 [Vespula pensylvanica]
MSCFGGQYKQIYLAEVLVEKLQLTPNRIKEIDDEAVAIKVKLLDFPLFEMAREDFESLKKSPAIIDKDGIIRFSIGRSCLFIRKPKDLVEELRTASVGIGVFRVGDTFPLAESIVKLSGCLCDQVAMSTNDPENMPKPFSVKGGFHLLDPGENPSGVLDMELKITCLGRFVTTKYELRPSFFVFKKENDMREFCVERNIPPHVREDLLKEDYALPESIHEKFMASADLKELAPEKNKKKAKKKGKNARYICDYVDLVSYPMSKKSCKKGNNSLQRASSSPRLSINDPGFKDLTTAEKLNNREYRNLIYKAYPNESTCNCLPINQTLHPLICRSGCQRLCCMKLRNPQKLIVICKNENLPSETKKQDKMDNERLRTGASAEDHYTNNSTSIDVNNNIEFTWYGDKITKENRLQGGGHEYELPGCVCSGAPSLYKKTEETGCKARLKGLEKAKPGCTCAGQSPPILRKASPDCNKKPCTGIDCILRAFKEAQEFVDSLGKVPGLEGLGLMDPSESPFFGRDISKDYETEEVQAERRAQAISSQLPVPNPRCTAPCNPRIGAHKFDTGISTVSVPHSTLPYTAATPLTIAVPGRTGVVREAVPALPDDGSTIVYAKPKKKEEKKEEKADKSKETEATPAVPLEIDLGPCGEPKCKSRRKKGTTTVESVENVEFSHKKSATQIKTLTTGVTTPLTGSKISEKGKHKLKVNSVSPSGDRSIKTPIKVSKRVMRYVYSIGDVYPGIHYGHKNCIDVRMRVPANMGWLWNTSSTLYNLKPRIGWKPGAIGRYLNELLKEAKAGSKGRPRVVPFRARKGKTYRSMSFTSVKKLQGKKENDEETELPPTLHIHRKDGTYYVTMYPIKQETMDVPKLEQPMKPLQFKIVKNKDDESVASSSTASDMEIEFSPPAAVNRYRKKPDVIHIDTQVKQQDILDALKITDISKKDKKFNKGRKLRK